MLTADRGTPGRESVRVRLQRSLTRYLSRNIEASAEACAIKECQPPTTGPPAHLFINDISGHAKPDRSTIGSSSSPNLTAEVQN
jgi:hypothetical protein